MKRFILTGAPGAGKTTLLHRLRDDGASVVEEGATDHIAAEQARGVAEPWTDPGFIEAIVEMQRARQLAAADLPVAVQFHDRSAICTYALARFLDLPIPQALTQEIERLDREAVFQRQVLFIDNLGFIAPTAARRITFEDAVRFERVHEEAYRAFGYDLIHIQAGSIEDREAAVRAITG